MIQDSLNTVFTCEIQLEPAIKLNSSSHISDQIKDRSMTDIPLICMYISEEKIEDSQCHSLPGIRQTSVYKAAEISRILSNKHLLSSVVSESINKALREITGQKVASSDVWTSLESKVNRCAIAPQPYGEQFLGLSSHFSCQTLKKPWDLQNAHWAVKISIIDPRRVGKHEGTSECIAA